MKIMGRRMQELSYFRTGKPDLKKEDKLLLRECFENQIEAIRQQPDRAEEMVNLLQGMY